MSPRKRLLESGRCPVIIGWSRTPIGDYGRGLRDVSALQLACHVKHHALKRAGVSPGELREVFLGQGFQSGYTPNLARLICLNEVGAADGVPGYTIDMQCCSGMLAVHAAMLNVSAGGDGIFLAIGVESMSQADYVISGKTRFSSRYHRWMSKLGRWIPACKMAAKFGSRPHCGWMEDAILPHPLRSQIELGNMAATAQLLASEGNIARSRQDEFALKSQERALTARDNHRFLAEIDPVDDGHGRIFRDDEHPRASNLKSLARLSPAHGTEDITAGNSSPLSDGASALAITNQAVAEDRGATILAWLTAECNAAHDPRRMGVSPVYAIQQLLAENDLQVGDIDLWEINEAFAAQTLACIDRLRLDQDKVNVNGGAIALGHPIGMSGNRIVATLAHELKRRGAKLGIAATCGRLGLGTATLVEIP